ncbi:hypothetical protein [Streptomyces olivaceus]|uniref:hypothetical protein n=1 Tax=Streptomyces olivaceus TaxID=47716 RepID=UPI001CCBC4C8|nr:hypothetical protein [Streptomyces olivaceus]MBZ6128533.1 hypothetical protein [Streptomyces olivaceus]MBZ6190688.1 hypothetical protein [Streptomyces olivaceus]MBZ6212008.1 hypothetical protein [Streptomyces olivaceus]MBZ6239201.1 hypothetical protein [Streptomyces olivaceus]MBZ6274435.1 hypothetical protein [Streptomyces olivaceus]
MSADKPDVPSTDFQPGDSLTGSAWPGILATVTAVPVATAVTVAGRVAKAHIEQRGETERTAIEQRGETRRAVIAAEVERERIRRPQLPAGDGDAA